MVDVLHIKFSLLTVKQSSSLSLHMKIFVLLTQAKMRQDYQTCLSQESKKYRQWNFELSNAEEIFDHHFTFGVAHHKIRFPPTVRFPPKARSGKRFDGQAYEKKWVPNFKTMEN